MLCPNCKNEKWNEPSCPGCGLDQKAALLALGERCRKEGRPLEAARAYDDYLRLDPDSWDALRQRAIAWYGTALAGGDAALFEKADQALARALEKEWDWEQGHQLRVNLAYSFDRLDDLRRRYQAQAQTPDRAVQAAKALKVIQLTEQFAQDAPAVPAGGEDEKKRSKWLLPLGLLTVPGWLWMILSLFPAKSPDGQAPPAHGGALFTLVALFSASGLVLVVLLLFGGKPKKAPRKPVPPLSPDDPTGLK